MLSAAARSLSRSKLAEGIAFRDRAPWWGGDLQTLRNHLLGRQQPLPSTTVTRVFPTSDRTGDRLMGRLEQPVRPTADTPLIVLIHGLTGCEDSTYVRRSARFHLMRGRRVLRLNLRGAGPARKLASGYYHAGCASDLQDVLAGQGVETIGQVMAEMINDNGKRLRIFRVFMECCAADKRPLAIPVEFPESLPQYKEMGWYKVTGKMSYREEGGLTVPVLEAETFAETEEPEESIMY